MVGKKVETSLKDPREGRFYLGNGNLRTVCSLKVELRDWAMQGCKGGPVDLFLRPFLLVPGTSTVSVICM